jgi:periplasmic mercuric ion binding protein
MRFGRFMLGCAFLIAGSAIGFVGCSPSTEATTTEIKLPTMQCGSCEQKISTAMKTVEGVKDVKIDLATRTATVSFAADKATVAKIEEAVVRVGYVANDKKADPKAYEKLDECCKVSAN